MKIIGVIFIVLSSLSVGLRYSYVVQQRCRTISQIIIAMRLLKSELCTRGTALPEAFGMLAAATSGSAAAYFSTAAKEMNRNRWMSPHDSLCMSESNLKEFSESDPVLHILRDFASGIGKFDLDCQVQSLDNIISRLEIVYRTAEQDKTVRSKTYRALGLCAGISLAILLI